MSKKKQSPEFKPYLGRLMESSWLDLGGEAHAFRSYGGRGFSSISECRQVDRGSDLPYAGPEVSRCKRCAAIMALPGMNERTEGINDG